MWKTRRFSANGAREARPPGSAAHRRYRPRRARAPAPASDDGRAPAPDWRWPSSKSAMASASWRVTVPSTEISASMASMRLPTLASAMALTRWLSTWPALASVDSRRRADPRRRARAGLRALAQAALHQHDGDGTKGDGGDEGFDGRKGQSEIGRRRDADGRQADKYVDEALHGRSRSHMARIRR